MHLGTFGVLFTVGMIATTYGCVSLVKVSIFGSFFGQLTFESPGKDNRISIHLWIHIDHLIYCNSPVAR